MPNVRVHKPNGMLFFDFRYQGVRCREYTVLPDTAANRKSSFNALHLPNLVIVSPELVQLAIGLLLTNQLCQVLHHICPCQHQVAARTAHVDPGQQVLISDTDLSQADQKLAFEAAHVPRFTSVNPQDGQERTGKRHAG